MNTPAKVERFLDALFTNGGGDKAARLVLTSVDGHDLGGWSRGPVRDLVMRHLVNPPEEKPKKRPTS